MDSLTNSTFGKDQTVATSQPKLSVFTITSFLICLYTLALVLAIVWIVWLYYRHRSAQLLTSRIRRKSFNQTDFDDLMALGSVQATKTEHTVQGTNRLTLGGRLNGLIFGPPKIGTAFWWAAK
ncbi:hypothetical protein BpHYR1_041254 [Brachionus plicatilis]|uniref:Uncharacterized protein n=1 Tax=Brachionus plicatilis TaxID=10195 RepID=A0A3M7PZ52_BRAPC|nr:hypothetical protein BpHYR1_041254 [Brachionus plicatilis]